MTCKDCIHNKICGHYVKSLSKSKGIDFDNAIEQYCEISECDNCEYFQNCSKFIELPCKVGDMVWFCSIPLNTMLPVKILELEMNNTTILYKGADTTYNEYIAFTEKDVNNSIFLNKEQAEQALRERENECK